LAYTAAASAAGVAAISLGQPCQAQIVFTKTHQYINPGSSYSLDLNNDGIADFTIGNFRGSCSTGPQCVSQTLSVNGVGTNQVWDNYSPIPSAMGLSWDQVIGPGDHFFGSGRMDKCKATQTSYYVSGSWVRGKHYLGFSFTIDGQIHYGWARLISTVIGATRRFECTSTVLLTGYAYNTVPGEPIRAGRKEEKGDESEPDDEQAATQARRAGSLGALALGKE
jgi:hypothetical protein